jgi:hypothetical protein
MPRSILNPPFDTGLKVPILPPKGAFKERERKTKPEIINLISRPLPTVVRDAEGDEEE